jgi:hypothetical protein
MDGALDVRMFLHNPSDQVPVGYVALIKDSISCKDPRTAQQRIQDDRGMSIFFQSGRSDGTNVASATSKENLHIDVIQPQELHRRGA